VLAVFHEERTIMNETNDLWYGYLEAGAKSSPVVIDPMLDTGNPKTLYMYNLNTNKITEYKREIAEPKLRALNAKEASLTQNLKQSYDVARKEFTPRNNGVVLSPAAVGAAVSVTPAKRNTIDLDGDSLDEFTFDDSDMDLDADMEDELDISDDE
jgi:hypothetical protein